MEDSVSNDKPPQIELGFWPFKLKATGDDAVQAVRRPVAIAIIVFSLVIALTALWVRSVAG
jgi:hypothetical protein